MVDFDQVTYVRFFFHLQGLVEVNLTTIEQVKQVHTTRAHGLCSLLFVFFIETWWWAEGMFFKDVFTGLFLTVCWSDYPTDFEVAVWDHGRFSSLLQSLGRRMEMRLNKKNRAQECWGLYIPGLKVLVYTCQELMLGDVTHPLKKAGDWEDEERIKPVFETTSVFFVFPGSALVLAMAHLLIC